LQVARKLGYRSFGTKTYHDDVVTMLERSPGRVPAEQGEEL
jgi:hypothetical protein